MGQQTRKTRSDKKKDVKAGVNIELRESIFRLSIIMTKPVKDICDDLIKNALFDNEEILKDLSKYLKRDIITKTTIFRGHLDNEKLYSVSESKCPRVSFRVKTNVHEVLSAFSYSFGSSISHISGVLLYKSITDAIFIEKYIESFLDSLDKSRKKELKQLLKYIRNETSEKYSMADLLSFLVEEPIRWIFPED